VIAETKVIPLVHTNPRTILQRNQNTVLHAVDLVKNFRSRRINSLSSYFARAIVM